MHTKTERVCVTADWYLKASEQGYAPNQYALGQMYFSGNGVLPDYQQAVNWYQKSAEQSNPCGQNGLATMYENGNGVPQNYKEAFDLYKNPLSKVLTMLNIG